MELFSCTRLKTHGGVGKSPAKTAGILPVALALLVGIFMLAGSGCSSKRKPSEFEKKKAEKEEILRRQEEERIRQERELRDLQRQKFWNEQLKRYE